MAIFLMFLAGACIACANFFMRKSIGHGGTAKGFLVFQMAIAFLVVLLLNPIRTGNYACNSSILGLGFVAGCLLAVMLFCLGRSLETGPAGLTISILNAATVMPAIIMFLIWGASYGFLYTVWHAIGSLVVLYGLFMATRNVSLLANWKKWFLFASSMFALHVLILVLYQWRAFLLNAPHPEEIVSFFTSTTIQSQWFAPMLYLTAMIWQVFFFIGEKRLPQRQEVLYGCIGGVLNGLCTYFMIWATEIAAPLENAVIFPIFSVATIVLSNLWSQKVYAEQVNWRACQFCAFGLIIGTVDWKAVAAAIGF